MNKGGKNPEMIELCPTLGLLLQITHSNVLMSTISCSRVDY